MPTSVGTVRHFSPADLAAFREAFVTGLNDGVTFAVIFCLCSSFFLSYSPIRSAKFYLDIIIDTATFALCCTAERLVRGLNVQFRLYSASSVVSCGTCRFASSR